MCATDELLNGIGTLALSLQVATQFKSSLLKLTDILMAKDAWYIRCLKPNESKQPGEKAERAWDRFVDGMEMSDARLSACTGHFDEALVRHQVKYLGLMEHLRVRRAGFAYRRKYEVFLKRYEGPQSFGLMLDFEMKTLRLSSCSPERLLSGRYAASCRYKPLCPATWPHWRGLPADGVEVLVQHLGYLPDEYKMGR